MANETVITIISFTGPSGSGKSELIKSLVDLYPDHCTMWQQFTTRKRRGPDDRYVFITPAQYQAIREQLTVRTDFGGNFYGTMPEAGAEGRAVLTIADKVGHSDLVACVEAHNRNLELNASDPLIGGAPRPQQFGASRVVLRSVLVRYQPTEEAVAARGRASRGLAFVQAELEGLADFPADHVIDTTGDAWPDPEQFFLGFVWPLISPPDWPEKAQVEIERAYEILSQHPETAEGIYRLLSSWRAEFERPPPPPALEAAGFLPFRAAEAPAGPPPPGDDIDGALAPPGEQPAAQPPAAAPSPEERMALLRAEAERAPPPEAPAPPPDEAERAPPPAAAPPPRAKAGPTFRTINDLINGADFETWIIRTRTGQNGFKSHSYFETMFRRYMQENGAVFPGRLDFGTPAWTVDPTDPKGQGRIRKFEVKHTYNGDEEFFFVEYNERLVRPTLFRVFGRVNVAA